jgi:hypothetical protein
VQRPARHLRYVLPGDREGDLDPLLDLPPRLVDEPEERARNALFHLLRREFDDPRVHLVHTQAHRPVAFLGEAVAGRDEVVPEPRGPGQRQAFARTLGGRGVGVAPEGGGDAEELSRGDVKRDDRLASRRRAQDPDEAVEQEVEPFRRVTFAEDARP